MRIAIRLAAVAGAVFVSALPTRALAQSEFNAIHAFGQSGWSDDSASSKPASAQTRTLTVDCAKGQTIARALSQGDERKPLVVIVRGACNENVTITRDDVTLQGDPASGGTINGPSVGNAITVRANRAVIDRLNVTGGVDGIRLIGAVGVDISNSTVQFTAQDGISASGTSALNITNCNAQYNPRYGVRLSQTNASISGGQISLNLQEGLQVDGRASVLATGVSVQSNGGSGIRLQSSYIRLEGSTVTANGTNATLAGTRKHGVGASDSSLQILSSSIANNVGHGISAAGGNLGLIVNSAVTGNGVHGVGLSLGAIANIGSSTISGNGAQGLILEMFSGAQVGNVTIQNNASSAIGLNRASKIWLPAGSQSIVGGNGGGVYCSDAESSIADISRIVFSPPNEVAASCTGF